MSLKFTYDYMEPGDTVSDKNPLAHNAICLDVGNSFSRGVIDHHHINRGINRFKNLTSSSQMLIILLAGHDRHVEPWPEAFDTLQKINHLKSHRDRVVLLIHKDPDLDSLVSAYILEHYIRDDFDEIKKRILSQDQLMAIIDEADRGVYSNPSFRNVGNIYYVLETIKAQNVGSPKSIAESVIDWENTRKTFFDFLDRYVKSPVSIDFDKYSKNYMHEHAALKAQMDYVDDYYRICLEESQHVEIPIFEYKNECFRVENRKPIFIRIGNRIAPLFNIFKAKYRLRSGRPWIVYYPEDPNYADSKHRFVISLEGNEKWGLFAYGWHLERLERICRESAFKRSMARGTQLYPPRIGTVRDGYDGPDPWYDGRNHLYTIVDSPARGTILAEFPEADLSLLSSTQDTGQVDRSGGEIQANIIGHIRSNHPRWQLSMVEALGDLFNRRNRLDALEADNRVIYRILKAVAEYLDNPSAKERLKEVLYGLVMMNSNIRPGLIEQGIDPYMQGGETPKGVSKDTAIDVGELCATNRSLKLIYKIFEIIRTARRESSYLKDLRQLIQDKSDSPAGSRFGVLKFFYNEYQNWEEQTGLLENSQDLFQIGERAEFLRNGFPNLLLD